MPRITRRRALVSIAGSVATALAGCQGKGGVDGRRGLPEPLDDAPERSRIVRTILSVSAIDGQGATVQRVFPTPALRNFDPFVLLDDFDVRVPAGFPDHPHRGFEAFTYMIEGAFHHRDSMGNDSVIGVGGTQRFTSGRGARHSEMPATDGSNRGLQLWVNLPRRLKTIAPEYEGLDGDRLVVERTDDLHVRTIVGPRSPVTLRTDVDYRDVELVADAVFETEIDEDRNSLVYVIAGTASIFGQPVQRGQAALVTPGKLRVTGVPGTRFAFLSGKPHHEPILHRGPFVD